MIGVGAQGSLARARMADPRRMTPEDHGQAHALLVRAVTDPDWQAANKALDELMRKLIVPHRAAGGRRAPPQARAAGPPDVTAAAPHALYPVTGPRRLWAAPVMAPRDGSRLVPVLPAAAGVIWPVANQVAGRARGHRRGVEGPTGEASWPPVEPLGIGGTGQGLEADVTAGGTGALLLSRARQTAPAGRTPGPFLSETRTLSACGPPRGRGRPPVGT
jgi:hypothetical protein